MGPLGSALALCFLLPWASAGPVTVSNCATECQAPSNPKLRYKIGHSYTYSFQTTTITTILGTTADQAVLEVKGQAVVTVRGPCDFVLQISKTSISGVEGKVDISQLEKYPLPYSFQDGTVNSVCPSEEDPVWAVNVKRSILSMLQHTAQSADVSEDHVIENDVIGRCPTTYAVESGSVVGASVKVVKTKVPNQCSERLGRHSAIPTTPYNVPAELQTVPVLNSTSQCVQQINYGIVESTRCKEAHLFKPLSSPQGGGARTEVSTQLTLTGNAPASAIKISGKFVKSSILFDQSGVNLQGETDKDISSVLKLICQSYASGSPSQVSQLFSQLVYSIRKASTKDVKNAYASVKGKKFCGEGAKIERLFLDALPQAGNAAATSLMVDLLKEDKLTERQALGWYVSLPLTKFATEESIKAVVSLVDKVQNTPVALLAISGLAQRYCSQKGRDCKKDSDIAQLNNQIAKILPLKCKADPKDEVKILSVLKALGNMGIHINEVDSLVKDCIREPSASNTVRLAAIEAFRNSPCSVQVETALLNLFADTTQDSELRIGAYLGALRCPTTNALVAIQNVLITEEYNQVRAFVKSHLENLQSNPTPGKEQLRRLVQNLRINGTVPDDSRKYSSNCGIAHFCNVHNAGWDLDSNLVFSSKSFIPRSAKLDLTVYLFGQKINLLEIGGRVENLERVLESYIGPDGTITREGAGSIVLKASDAAEDLGSAIVDGISSALRNKRSINRNDVAAFDKVVDVKKDYQAGVKLDSFVRVFGTEIGLLNYRRGFDQKPAILEGLKAKLLAAAKNFVEGAKKVEIDVARSLMLLDTAATFPTVGGLPIKLAVNATTTVALGLESQLDLAAVLKDPRNVNLKLKVSPSAVTDVSASMTVDMAVVRTGVKLVATLHSAAAADFSAKVKDGSSLEVKVELPKSRLTLVDFQSEVLFVQQKANDAEKSKKIPILSEAKYTHGGCAENYSFITGLRFCASSSLQMPRPLADPAKDPAPAFPLSGHGSFAIYVEKTEPGMQGYVLSASMKTDGQSARSVTLTLDTPGSKTNRKITGTGVVKFSPNLGFKIDAKAPWATYSADGELVLTNDVRSAQLRVVKEKNEYFTKVQLKVVRSGKEVSYVPTLELGYPGQKPSAVWEGKLAYIKGNALEISSKPVGPWSNLPWGIQGSVIYDNTPTVHKFSIPLAQIVTPLGKVSFSTAIGRQDRSYAASLELKYGAQNHGINLQGLIEDLSKGDERQYKTSLVYKSTRFPVSNIDFKWDSQYNSDLVSNTVVLVHGPESEASSNRIYLNQFSKLKGAILRDFHLENKLEVSYPRLKIDGKVSQLFKFDDRSVSGNLLLLVSSQKIVDGELNVLYRAKDPKTLYEASAKLAYPGRSIAFRDLAKKLDDKRYTLSPSLDIKPGKKYELSAQATVGSDRRGFSVAVDADLRVEGLANPIKVRHNSLIADGSVTTDNKFDWDGQTRATFEVKINHKASVPAVSAKLSWKERVDATLEAKISRRDSKVDLDVKLLRLQRRIKASGSLRNDKVTDVTLSTNVAWDADNDPSKQVGVDLAWDVESGDQHSVEIKAGLNLFNNRYGTSANGKAKIGQGFANSEYSGRVELELPQQNKAVLSVSLANSLRDEKMANRLESELVLPSSEVYRLILNNAIERTVDRNQVYTANAVIDVNLKSPFTDEIKLRGEAKRTIRSDRRNTDLKLLLTAPKFGHTLDVSAAIEVKKDNIRINSVYQRGPVLISVEATGKLSTAGSKVTAEGFLDIKAPKLPWQQVKISSVTTYQLAADSYELSEKLTIQYQNFKTITLDARSKLGSSALDVTLMLETPYQNFRRQGLTVGGRYDPGAPRLEGSAGVTWSSPDQRQGREVRLELEFEPRGNSLLLRLGATTPLKNYESAELRFDGRSLNNGKTLEADFAAALGDKKVKLGSRIQLNPNQYEVDVTLNLPSSNPMRLLIRFGAQGATYSTENRVDWGSGTLSVKGNIKYVDSENFDGSLTLDSPALNINGYEIQVLSKPEGKKRLAEILVNKKTGPVASIKTSYERKDSKTGTNIQGTGDLSIKELNINSGVKFVVEDKIVDKSDEKGNEYKFNVEATNAKPLGLEKFTSSLKRTTKERSGAANVCYENQQCLEVAYSFKDTSAKGASSFEGFGFYKKKRGSSEFTQGLSFKRSLAGTKYELNIENFFHKEKKELAGLKIYRKDGEYGIEVYTPKKLAAVVLESEVKGKAPKQQYKNTISVWLDKKSNSKNKFVIATVVDFHKLDDMEGHTLSLTLKHPSLPRELEYRAEYHLGTKDNLVHTKLDIDTFSSAHQRWSLESKLKRVASNYTLETELRSKGANVAVKLLAFAGSAPGNQIYGGANLKFLDKETVDKELFVDFKSNGNSAAVVLGSPLKQIEFAGEWEIGTFYTYPEVKFTGSSNILSLSPTVLTLKANTLPNAEIRVYNKAAPENVYIVSGGFSDLNNFELGVQKQFGASKKDLVVDRVSLAEPDTLHVRLTWSVQELRNLAAVIRSRAATIRAELVDTVKTLREDLAAHRLKWRAFDKFGEESARLVTDYKQQVDKITSDTKDESFQRLAYSVSEAHDILQEVLELLSVAGEGLGEVTAESLEQLRASFQDLRATLREGGASVKEVLLQLVGSVGEYVTKILEVPARYLEKISGDWSKVGGILPALQSSYANLKARIASHLENLPSYFGQVFSWLKSISSNGGSSSISQYLSEIAKKYDLSSIDDRIVYFVKDLVVSPVAEIERNLVAKYPELTRFFYRWNKRLEQLVNEVAESDIGKKPAGLAQVVVDSASEDLFHIDIEKGKITLWIPLYQKVSSLRRIGDLLEFDFSEDSLSFEDMYQQLRASYHPLLAKKRLRSQALLIGSLGYVTFDKRFYDFKGNCQYLLAHDFLNGDFSVAVKYEDTSSQFPRKVITFADQNDQVTISNKILINDKPAALPAKLKSLTVTREGDVVKVNRGDGAVLACDLENDVCSFEISAFYFSRTRGLWGNFNNEPADDLAAPNGKVVKDIASLANEWKMSKTCQDKIETLPVVPASSASAVCTSRFSDDSSPLRSCFSVIPAKPYENLCNKLAARAKGTSALGSVMNSVAVAYTTSCSRFGILV